jgi:Transposase IS66 family
LIWWLYADLKAWQREPCPRRAAALRARFERIFTRRTGYVVLDRLLARLHRRKAELLCVLERPEIPLHTNGSENDIRACVTKRKISGGTISQDGRIARDVLLVSCTWFLWTPICPRRNRNDDVQYEEDRSVFSR